MTKTSSPFALRILNVTVLHFNASEDRGMGQTQNPKKLHLKQPLNEDCRSLPGLRRQVTVVTVTHGEAPACQTGHRVSDNSPARGGQRKSSLLKPIHEKPTA